MQSRSHKLTIGLVTVALGLGTLGTPAVTLAQGKAPPPPPGAQPPAPQSAPQGSLQPPPSPPVGAQPPPGYAPYPYPPQQYPPPGYPPPYGYPGYPAPPETLPYKSDQPIPPGYKLQQKTRVGLVIAGSIVLGIFYLGSVSVGVQELNSSRAPYPALLVPVLGPFIVGAAGNFSSGSGFFTGGTNMLYILNGLVQAGSASMILAGVLAKKKVLVRQDLVEEAYKPQFLVGPGSVGMKLAF